MSGTNPSSVQANASQLDTAARVLREADALLITAGAGMGVDSGLPDFRGTEGFWRAYPPCRHLNIDFAEMSSPPYLEKDPTFGWGFWGHRYMLYRDVTPHLGFHYLLEMAKKKKAFFVYTSNVDGEFQKAGFPEDSVLECHGTVHLLQCLKYRKDCPGGGSAWPALEGGPGGKPLNFDIDPETFRVPESQLPKCIHCGGMARPHVWMASKDWTYNATKKDGQEEKYAAFYDRVKAEGLKLAIVEIGAGIAIPSVRRKSEQTAEELKGTLIRVNLRESEVPPPDGMYVLEEFDYVSLPMKGLEAIHALTARADPDALRAVDGRRQ